jgi:hypothetical protein
MSSTAVGRALQGTKTILQINVERETYARRLRFSIYVLIAAALAWVALDQGRARELVDGMTLDVGRLVAGILILLMSIRVTFNFFRWRNRPDETIKFFNKGFSWTRKGQEHRYGWGKVQNFREGGHTRYLFKRPFLQWGHHTLTMADGQVFRLAPWHGDLQKIARAIRPVIAEVTGIRIGRRLREEKPVQVHRRLIVWPGGLQIGKQELPWKVLSVGVKNQRLVVKARERGKVRTVGRFSIHSIDNLGGFMEIATETIRTHR